MGETEDHSETECSHCGSDEVLSTGRLVETTEHEAKMVYHCQDCEKLFFVTLDDRLW